MIRKTVYRTVGKQFDVYKIAVGSKSWFYEIEVKDFVGWLQNGL